jgi:hypothetical protein
MSSTLRQLLKWNFALLLLLAASTGAKETPAETIPPPRFSLPGGIYTNDQTLQLTADKAVIHFSLDGTEPGPTSLVYQAALKLTNCVLIRAKAWYADGRVSPVLSQAYILLGDDLQAFNSNLPLIVLRSSTGEIAPAEKSLGALNVVDGTSGEAGSQNRTSLARSPSFKALTVVNVRGHSSLRYPKHSYNIKLVNEALEPEKAGLLGMPKESDWVLYGPYPDKTLMRDVLAYELSNQMGHWAPRSRFVEVFVSENGTKLGMEDYAGVYVFEEKITRDKNRVNIAKLDPSTTHEPDISGGYIFKKDHTSSSERKTFGVEGPPQAASNTNRSGYPTPPGGFPANAAGFFPSYTSKTTTNRTTRPAPARAPRKPKADPNRVRTNYVAAAAPQNAKLREDTIFRDDEGFRTQLQRNQFYYFDPEPDEITGVQRAWLKDYISRLESALYGPNFREPSGGYQAFIDRDSFIDYHLLVEVTKNVDGFRFSTFYYKDRGRPLQMGPLWDWNLSLGNADGKQGYMPDHWLWPQLDDQQYSWFRRLFEDPDFAQRYVDRWAQLRTNVFATSNLLARIETMAQLLDEAQERNFAKWEILGRDVNPNYFVGNSYDEEVDWMKNWISNRLSWIEAQFLAAPAVTGSSSVTLATTEPDSLIYYTIDGEDPRSSGGAVSSRATRYTAPVSISSGARLFARTYANQRWSPPTVVIR